MVHQIPNSSLNPSSETKLIANTGGDAQRSTASQTDAALTKPHHQRADGAKNLALVPSEVISANSRRPISERRLAANRRNGARSRGPKTAAGKAISRCNATKHGLLSKEIFLANQDNPEAREEYAELLANLRQDRNPVGVLENMLVERMAIAWWRLGCVLRFELRQTNGAMVTSESTLPIPALYGSASADILGQIRNDPEGMAARLHDAAKVITRASNVILKRGYLKRSEIENLRSVPGDTYQRCRAHHQDREPPIFLDCIYEDGDPRNHIAIQGQAMLKELRMDQAWLGHYRRVCTEVQRNPELRAMISRPDIPDQQAADCIRRYETTIERQFYQAMDQLERLQRRRQGEPIPPPEKLSFRSISGCSPRASELHSGRRMRERTFVLIMSVQKVDYAKRTQTVSPAAARSTTVLPVFGLADNRPGDRHMVGLRSHAVRRRAWRITVVL